MEIPGGLRSYLGAIETGRAWLEGLPALVDQLANIWDLDVGDPFEGSNVSWVAPALHEGEHVVLKVQWPHDECKEEAAALRTWAGDGAVQLIASDPDRHALLLERCLPGTPLADDGDADALAVMIDLLPPLWKTVGPPFESLAHRSYLWNMLMVDRWNAADRPCERRLVDSALMYLDELPGSQGEQVLVNQDLHGDNVLAARRQPWLVIDPKPLVGEREFAVAPVVRSFEFGHSRDDVVGRLDRLCAELGLDRERARGWTIAQTMAWSFSSDYASRHYDTVRWLLDA